MEMEMGGEPLIHTCSDWYSQEVVDERKHEVDPDPLDRLLG